MKFSFQMVVIAFVVTLAHLLVLATLSPTGVGDSDGMTKFEDDSMEEVEIESFPVVSEIPLASEPEQPIVESGYDGRESETIEVDREERVEPSKAADFVNVTREESQPIPREESASLEENGPHEIRQIAPKPRS